MTEEKGAQVASLEEKHQHAREALEHYRASVKDQRDQDQRRHEHQVQQLQAELRQLGQTLSVKQADITQLNKANGELTSDLKAMRKQLAAAETAHRQDVLEYVYDEENGAYRAGILRALPKVNV